MKPALVLGKSRNGGFIMELKRTVRCLQSYVENADEIWTKGTEYGAKKHRDGSWSIETNFGNIGKVGADYLLDSFEGNFIECR